MTYIIAVFLFAFLRVGEQCCMPKMYEGIDVKFDSLSNDTAIKSVTATRRHVAYDAVNQMIAVNGNITTSTSEDDSFSDSTTSIHMIQFFRNQTQYVITKTGCTSRHVPHSFVEDCLPANVSKIRQCTSGTQTYESFLTGIRGTYSIDNDCFMYKTTAEGYIDTINKIKSVKTFLNYRKTITDRSVFQLPSSCLNLPTTTGNNPNTGKTPNAFFGIHYIFG